MKNMKKFLSLVLVLCMVNFVGVISVSAANFSLSPNNKTIKLKEQINVVAGLSGYSGQSIRATIDYSDCSNVLQKRTDSVPINSAEFEVSTDGNFATISFVGKAEGTCKIKLNSSNPNIMDVESTITVISSSTITTKPPETTTTPPPKQEAPKSNNANLKSLKITGNDDSEVLFTPEFKPDVYEYTAEVPSTTKLVNINAEMDDSKATMIISDNASKELKPGENNKIVITITAEDGTKKAYTINIKREALTADATLKELTIKEDKLFKLKDNKFVYTVKIKKDVKKLTLSYVLSDDNSLIEIDGNENLKDGSKVKITVTAEDGTKKVYTLNIEKEVITTKADTSKIETEKNPLIIMGLSIIAFGLIGGIIYVIKK